MPSPSTIPRNLIAVDDPAGRWYFDPEQTQERVWALEGRHLQLLYFVHDEWVRATWHDAGECHTDDEWYDNVAQISAAEAVAWCLDHGAELPAELAKIKPGPPPDSRQVTESTDGQANLLARIVELLVKKEPAAVQVLEPLALSHADAAKFIGAERPETIEHLIRTRQIEYVQVGEQRGKFPTVEGLKKFVQKRTMPTGEEMRTRRSRR